MSPREGEGAAAGGGSHPQRNDGKNLPNNILSPAQHHRLSPPHLKMMGKVGVNPHGPRDKWGN